MNGQSTAVKWMTAVVCGCVLLVPHVASANDPLITDRPDFTELIFFDRESERGPSTTTFQTGVTYLINPDVQLDFRAARRLSSEGADILIGLGASARF